MKYKEKFKELIRFSLDGMREATAEIITNNLLKTKQILFSPILEGTKYYGLYRTSKDEVKIIDGETYTREVPFYYIVGGEWTWTDAALLKMYPQKAESIFLNIEEARAAAKELNEGKKESAEFLNKKLNIPDIENLESEIHKEATKSETHFDFGQMYNRFIKGD